MKWVIGSDLHGSAKYTEQFFQACDREGSGKILLLGDLLYHGPRNDLPEAYEPKKVIGMLNERKDRILCVRGNCDTEVDQMVLAFPIMADYAYIDAEGVRLFATHGHHFNTQTPPPLGPGEILLHGHTHVPAWERRDGYIYMNPGSVSIPKAGSPRGYMTLERGRFRWKTLEGNVYHEEDMTERN